VIRWHRRRRQEGEEALIVRPTKAVVQAGLDDMEALIERRGNAGGSARIGDEIDAVTAIDEKIFGLGRSVVRHHCLDAGARGPARPGGRREGRTLGAQVAAELVADVDERGAASDTVMTAPSHSRTARAEGGVPVGLETDEGVVVEFGVGAIEAEPAEIAFEPDQPAECGRDATLSSQVGK
jgi:hypothetical protein